MLKKYALIGILVITGALALSAFVPAGDPSVPTNAIGVADANFRTPHLWSGMYIPSMEVAGSLTGPITAFVPDMSENGFRKAHMWNNMYIPSMDVTGLLKLPVADSPNITATGFARPVVTPSLWAITGHDEIIATGFPRFGLIQRVRPNSAHDEVIATGIPRFGLILPVLANNAHDEVIATGFPRPGVTRLQPHIKLNSGH